MDQLPAYETVELQPIHPEYLTVIRIEWLITTLILFAAVLMLFVFTDVSSPWNWLAVAGVILLSLIYWVMQEKSFVYTAFAVRDQDVIVQKGWIIRSTKICPFNRIQNCSVHQGPLERKYELATLNLYTAGAAGLDMRIPGLTLEEANNLRQFILNKINSENVSTD